MTNFTRCAVLIAAALLAGGCGDDSGGDPPADDSAPGGDVVVDTGGDGPLTDGEIGDDSADGPAPCTNDDDCAGEPVGACDKAVCDVSSGACLVGTLPDGVPCSDDPCQTGQVCQAGTCMPGAPAEPDCGAAECGLDACGHGCGSCEAGWSCSDAGLCVDDSALTCDELDFEGCCTPSGALFWCDDGDVGTLDCAAEGATCGWSASDGFYVCGAAENSDPSGDHPWLCPGSECDDPCAGRECGAECGVSCGSCADGETCTPDGACEACTCDDKACGEDACGSSCGTCSGELVCVANQCVESECDGLTYEGCCADLVLTWCEDGLVETIDCETSCGWSADDGFYNCNQEGPEPTGTFPLACEEPLPPVDEDPDADLGPEEVEEVEAVEAVEPVQGAELVEAEPVPDTVDDSALGGDAAGDDVGPTPVDDISGGDAAPLAGPDSAAQDDTAAGDDGTGTGTDATVPAGDAATTADDAASPTTPSPDA